MPQKCSRLISNSFSKWKEKCSKELLLSTGYVFGQRTHYCGMQHAMHCFSDEVISKNINRLFNSMDFSSRQGSPSVSIYLVNRNKVRYSQPLMQDREIQHEMISLSSTQETITQVHSTQFHMFPIVSSLPQNQCWFAFFFHPKIKAQS